MAQTDFTVVNATLTSGSAFVNLHNLKFAAVISMHSGPLPPQSAPLGFLWLDTSTSSVPVIRVRDGSQWVGLIAVDKASHKPRFVMDADRDSYLSAGDDGEILFTAEGTVAANFSGSGITLGTSTNGGIALDLSHKTDALAFPKGPTNQRPSADKGRGRWNSTIDRLEIGNGSTFKSVAYTDDPFTPGDNTVGTDQLKVSGPGQLRQYFSSDGDGTASWRDLPSGKYTRATPINSAAVMQWSDLPSDLEEIIVCGDFARNAAGGTQIRSMAIQLGPDSDGDGFPIYYERQSYDFLFNAMCKFVRLYGNLWMIETPAEKTRDVGGIVSGVVGGGGGGGGGGNQGAYRTINGELSSVRITYWGYQNNAWSKNTNWGSTYSGQAHLLYR